MKKFYFFIAILFMAVMIWLASVCSGDDDGDSAVEVEEKWQ